VTLLNCDGEAQGRNVTIKVGLTLLIQHTSGQTFVSMVIGIKSKSYRTMSEVQCPAAWGGKNDSGGSVDSKRELMHILYGHKVSRVDSDQ